MKYAMSVHPKVLEKDFETTVDLNNLKDIYNILKGKELEDIPDETLTEIAEYLRKAWFLINKREGINLRDREKLAPVFSELNRIVKGSDQVNKAYRGVRLSSFDPNALSRTYPNSINDPEVLEHLESLAYGLRSWGDSKNMGLEWAMGKDTTKDKVLFEIDYPEIVLESYNLFKYLGNRYFMDYGELVLNIKNPKILNIEFNVSYFTVKIKDMG